MWVRERLLGMKTHRLLGVKTHRLLGVKTHRFHGTLVPNHSDFVVLVGIG